MKRYQQFARMKKARHSPNLISGSPSLFNSCFGYEQLNLKGGKALASVSTATYLRDKTYGRKSIKQTAQTSMLPAGSVVRSIIDTANREHPEIFFIHEGLNRVGANMLNEIRKLVDCRPISIFLHSFSLKSSTSFMKVDSELGEPVQLNINRCC